MEQTKTPLLTQHHTDILLLLYRFRFLTRPQIQKLLNHKSHKRIIQRLNDLTENNYVRKYYDRKSVVIPAMYSLGKASRKVLLKNGKTIAQLKRIRWEARYSETFREKCTLVAEVYLTLTDQSGGALRFWAKSDMDGVQNLIEPAPDAYFIIKAKRYFLDIFTAVPNKVLYSRVQRYAEYFNGGEWQEQTKTEFPEVIIVCSSPRSAQRLNYYIKSNYSDEPDLRFRVASSDQALEGILPKKKA